MKIEIRSYGPYKILGIEDELNIITDLSELKFIIDGYITQGKNKIAVSFKLASYIYSGAIAVLMECHKVVSAQEGGCLCVIEPHQDIRNIFSVLNINKILTIYDSETELPIPG